MVLGMTRPAPRLARILLAASLLVAPFLATGCASLDFDRTAPNAGRFESSAWSLTFFGYDFPTHALLAARANASDAGQPNTIVTYERVLPHLGPFDWILDILSIRWAKVEGTWGYEEE